MSSRSGAILAVAAVVAAFLLMSVWPREQRSAVPQPIQFNHSVHVKKEPCQTCHRAFEHGPAAGNPTLAICMDCHTNTVSDSPEEEKLRVLEKNGGRLNWIRVTRVPPHVRFSHQRHVVVGKLPCQTCHGEIAKLTEPPVAPLISIEMGFCIDCHRSKRFRLAPGSLEKLAQNDFDPDFLEGLGAFVGRGFRSRKAFFAALDAASPEPLDATHRKTLLAQTEPAAPVSTDCIACHR